MQNISKMGIHYI